MRLIPSILIVLAASFCVFAQPLISERLSTQLEQSNDLTQYFDVYILLKDRIDIEALDKQFYRDKVSIPDRVKTLLPLLKQKAALSQEPVLGLLSTLRKVDQQSIETYWITNAIFFKAQRPVIELLSQRQDLEIIDLNGKLALDEPIKEVPLTQYKRTLGGRERGLTVIKAHRLWAKGYTGYGRLAMGMDTGINWQHPALQNKFRGNTHPLEYAWYIHNQGAAIPTDCGSNNHGTHTMGTILGMDPATQDTIGVAFGAQWIGSPNLCSSSTAKSISIFQWAANPDGNINTISDMPDVINNSWYDPDMENECGSVYKLTFDALEAIGIAIVFSAGNEGPGLSSITAPKNINTNDVNVFCVGNVNANPSLFLISSSSSRGPSTCGDTAALLIKPEVVAPGTSIRSCVGVNGYDHYSGTSMSAPHVSGAILLLKEAFPYLTGTEIKRALYYTSQDLGSFGEDNIYGRGIINLEVAYNYLIAQGNTPADYMNDAAVLDIANLNDRVCDFSVAPKVVICNKGRDTLKQLQLSFGYNSIDPDTIFWNGSLVYNEVDTIQLPVKLVNVDEYALEVNAFLPNGFADERTFNDWLKKDFIVSEVVDYRIFHVCENQYVDLFLNKPITGNYQWYDEAVGGSLLKTGDTLNAYVGDTDTAWYFELVETAHVGEADNSNGTGRHRSSTDWYLVFDAYIPFALRSVLVYADGGGDRTIELRDSSGNVLQSTIVNVPDGTHRIQLDFEVPQGKNLQLAGIGKTDMYRNSAGLSYPYTVSGVLSIKYTNHEAPTKYYYYFYDWEVEYSIKGRMPFYVYPGTNSSSGGFTAYPKSPVLSESGNVQFTDTTDNAESWHWNFGDGNTSMLQNPVNTYTQAGTYQVRLIVTKASGCMDTITQSIEVTVGIHEIEGIVYFDILPNPAHEVINIKAKFQQATYFSFSVMDVSGKRIQPEWQGHGQTVDQQISLASLPAGMYYIVMKTDFGYLARKLVRL